MNTKIDDAAADDARLRYESENTQLRDEIDRLQSAMTESAAAIAQLEGVAAEARRNDAIAMSWISEAKHAIGYEGDMPGFIEALRALKANFCGTGYGDDMPLRDYFAAEAMPLAWKFFDEQYSTDDLTSENIARAAYQIADAMIKVREEREGA